MGAIPREEMSMDRIRKWMEENPEEAKEVRAKNRSYVFFREFRLSATEEPKGAQGVSLTPGRSIAVDKALHIYGTPFYIEAELPIDGTQPKNALPPPDGGAGHRLGHCGAGAGRSLFRRRPACRHVAGRIRHPGRFAMLVPRELDFADTARSVPLPPRAAGIHSDQIQSDTLAAAAAEANEEAEAADRAADPAPERG